MKEIILQNLTFAVVKTYTYVDHYVKKVCYDRVIAKVALTHWVWVKMSAPTMKKLFVHYSINEYLLYNLFRQASALGTHYTLKTRHYAALLKVFSIARYKVVVICICNYLDML